MIVAAKKLTVIDLLQRYIKTGKTPPAALLELAYPGQAEQTAVAPMGTSLERLGGGNLAEDPLIGLPASLLGFGLEGTAMNALPLAPEYGGFGERLGERVGQEVPQLLKMAQKGVSGAKKGIPAGGGAATSDLLGGKTESLPNAASEQDPFKDWTKNLTEPTDILHAEDFPSIFQDLAKTGPLAPQGAVTTFGFGVPSAWGKKAVPVSPKTEKLTPFEAHENVVPDSWGGVGWSDTDKKFHATKSTKPLPGAVKPEGITRARATQPYEADPRTMPLESADIEQMTSAESPRTEDLVNLIKQNLSPKDTLPLPENTLYHGLNVFSSNPARRSMAGIASEGMKGGWFAEEPHQPFGPYHVAATPEDLPPMIIRNKQFSVDPTKELIPTWNNFPQSSIEALMKAKGHNPAETLVPDEIKGRPAKRSLWANIHQLMGADEQGVGYPYSGQGGAVVPPEKLFLADKKGDIIGRMAPKSGQNAVSRLWDKVAAFKKVLTEGGGKRAVQDALDDLMEDIPK